MDFQLAIRFVTAACAKNFYQSFTKNSFNFDLFYDVRLNDKSTLYLICYLRRPRWAPKTHQIAASVGLLGLSFDVKRVGRANSKVA
jgi:hypothetical protein